MIDQKDRELIQKIIARDERAMMELYKTYKAPILRFISRQLKSPERAEELVQDVFFDFIEKVRDFRGESSIKTFLFSIARYKIIDEIRKKKIKRIFFSTLPGHLIEKFATVILDDEIEKAELSEKISRTLSTLPNEYELVLRLKYVEGSKVKAIASRLSLSFKATESLIFRARQAFIKAFSKLP